MMGGRKQFNFNPLPSYEGRRFTVNLQLHHMCISIHSPHTRGDSISLQKSIRIYVSLHNKTMIHRFSGLYLPQPNVNVISIHSPHTRGD